VILNGDKQQEWVRPRLVEGLLVDDGTTYITLTEFTLADGTRHLGYCSPCDPSGLDYIQPIIVTPQGQVRFWYDWQPDFEAINRCMEFLGKTKAEIFPVEYRSLVQCDGSFWHGTIEEADL
jgi:hypothetical protein